MRGKSLKWLALIIPLILSLAVTDVASSPGATVYVENVIDETKQATSTVNIRLSISDVSNLFSWQCNMSWDPSVLQATDVVFGDFLQGNPNETLESSANQHFNTTMYTSLTNPWSAHDGYVGTYASLEYSEADGSFGLQDFTIDPYGSMIIQVDLNVRYSATASLDDQYRIVYYADPDTKYELVGWTSDAASLATHTWTNPTNPFEEDWWWWCIQGLKIAVETDRVGGDATAVFNFYEAWLTVTYLRPTSPWDEIHNVEGWALIMESTWGEYPVGISGSGWLANVTFQVLAYGATVLNITDPLTLLMDPLYNQIPCTIENGYFRNTIPGDMVGDPPDYGPPDGDVDRYDFGEFMDAYPSIAGDPEYNILADLVGDPPDYGPPDGDIDRYDFGVFMDNYPT